MSAARVGILVAVACLSLRGVAGTLAPFVFVMIDSETERVHGSLPFNRAVMANTVERLAGARPKGVIIKFFYDLPSTEDKDSMMERSICAARVALQASLNDTEGTTNRLEPKFEFGANPFPVLLPLFSGDKAFIPLERFRRCAKEVGFVDSTSTEIPMFEVYQGRLVKSLHLVALEMASNLRAEPDLRGFVQLGNARLDLMHQIAFPNSNTLSYIRLHDILSDKVTNWRAKVEGSVVLIGYDGTNIHTINTPLGEVGAHRFFVLGLRSLADAFEKATADE